MSNGDRPFLQLLAMLLCDNIRQTQTTLFTANYEL